MAVTSRLILDPIACEAHGLCADLLPERISLDEWGYPMIDDEPIERQLVAHARRAVSACPTLALALARREREAARPRPANGSRT